VLCGKAFCDDLRFRFQPDDKFYLTSTTEQKITRVVDGNEIAIEQVVCLGCDLDIEEVSEDGNAWAKYTYRKTNMKIKGAGGEVSFDSDVNLHSAPANVAPPQASSGPKSPKSPASSAGGSDEGTARTPPKGTSASQPRYNMVPPQALPLVLALRESFYMQITPQGRIGKINGLQEIVSFAKSKMPNIDIKTQVIQAVERMFNEASVKKELEDQFAVFPPSVHRTPDGVAPVADSNLTSEHARLGEASRSRAEKKDTIVSADSAVKLSVGDTWSRGEQVNEDSNGSPIETEQTFRLKERRPGGIAVVEVNIVVRPSDNIQEIVVGDFKARREVRGRGSGQIEIEESTGRIINSTLTQDLVDETKLSPQGMMLRIPPNPEPTRRHIVTTFQMTRREEETGSKPAEPNQP
jgi:hypothetical protein